MDLDNVLDNVEVKYYPNNAQYAPHETYIASVYMVNTRSKKGYSTIDGCGRTKEEAIQALYRNYSYYRD